MNIANSRKTKVVATIGPACNELEIIEKMLEAGMSVARLNMSHGDFTYHAGMVEKIREASKNTGMPVAIMLDTKGREIRTEKLNAEKITLTRGQEYILFSSFHLADAQGVSLSFPGFADYVAVGEKILIDDGQIELSVEKISKHVLCRVQNNGVLGGQKGVNLPQNKTIFDHVVYDDSSEVQFAVDHNVEYIAMSFVRNAKEVHSMKSRLQKMGVDTQLMAKIESREGVDNLEEIIKASDGILIARGDLGVELDLSEGPTIQKKIIRATVGSGKPVITATQMLDSMERNLRPTRAEVSDVANAIFDGTSAVMLSGETASGRYPVEAVKTMVQISTRSESMLSEFGYLQNVMPQSIEGITEAVAQAAIVVAKRTNAKIILALTETGTTARLISKYRPDCMILALTTSERVCLQLSVNWGIRAIHDEKGGDNAQKIKYSLEEARKMGLLAQGDVVVLTAGNANQAGSTNLIRVITTD